jgi:hypothetical protein
LGGVDLALEETQKEDGHGKGQLSTKPRWFKGRGSVNLIKQSVLFVKGGERMEGSAAKKEWPRDKSF